MSISSSEPSIYDKEYYTYHLELLTAFSTQIQQLPPFNTEFSSEDDQEFLAALELLLKQPQGTGFLEQGQVLMCRVVGSYPHLMPLLYRDLLWFFGGDCLHYMPDEEIAVFQRLDEQREDAKQQNTPFSYKEARAKSMGMH
ncbi:PA2817 family protein [Cellvibrio sp. pealriver]|uniref:PA2817 family protein n=1 Tax=Cellvibrio sp. pealriver TaxID=1622269 RepID=UPI000A89D31A|nr:PA2817 family protein [Cellvibrio sp. pealriver]